MCHTSLSFIPLGLRSLSVFVESCFLLQHFLAQRKLFVGYFHQFFIEKHLQVGRSDLYADIFFSFVQVFHCRLQIQFRECYVVYFLKSAEQWNAGAQVQSRILGVEALIGIVCLKTPAEIE